MYEDKRVSDGYIMLHYADFTFLCRSEFSQIRLHTQILWLEMRFARVSAL